MLEPTLQPEPPRAAPLLHSMQAEGRTREKTVETQIAKYLAAPRSLFWQHARMRDHHAPDWVQEETLVALLRVWEGAGEREAAAKVVDLLLERTAPKITRQIACWRLAPQHVEDCIRDVQVQMIEAVYSASRSHEFWEVRFWVCLERRINTIARRYRNMAEKERTLDPIEDDQGHETDRLDQMAAPCPVTPQQRIEFQEALSLLTDRERCAFVLFNGEKWTQAEIAALLGVTDKTVRNLLTRAHQRLQPWRNEDLH